MIIVYSQPACQQCIATAKFLDKLNVKYDYVDVTEEPEAYAYVRSLGYRSVPVVRNGDEHWQGFRPDLLKALAD